MGPRDWLRYKITKRSKGFSYSSEYFLASFCFCLVTHVKGVSNNGGMSVATRPHSGSPSVVKNIFLICTLLRIRGSRMKERT